MVPVDFLQMVASQTLQPTSRTRSRRAVVLCVVRVNKYCNAPSAGRSSEISRDDMGLLTVAFTHPLCTRLAEQIRFDRSA